MGMDRVSMGSKRPGAWLQGAEAYPSSWGAAVLDLYSAVQAHPGVRSDEQRHVVVLPLLLGSISVGCGVGIANVEGLCVQASPGAAGVERRAAKGVVFPGLVGLALFLGHLGHGIHLGHSLLGNALYT